MSFWSAGFRGIRCLASLVLLGCDQSAAAAPEGLDPAVAQAQIAGDRASLETCNDGSEETTLEVTILVAPSGEVRDVHASGSARLGPCVERVIRQWEFPSAPSETEIEVPITFAASEAAEETAATTDESPDDDESDEPDSEDETTSEAE